MFIEHKAQPFALANKGSLSYPQPLLQSFRNSPFGYGAFAIIAADSECKILPLRPSSRGNLLASLAGSFFFRKNINPLRSNVFYYSSSSSEPFIPSAKNIKVHFNLAEEPLFIFNDVNEGLECLKTRFKGISGIYGFVCII